MSIHTPLCDLLGIEFPIGNAGMAGGTALAPLAMAVSKAGGLGAIGGIDARGPEFLRAQIRAVRAATDRPFSVNLIAWILDRAPAFLDVCIDERVTSVTMSFGEAAPHIARAKDAGLMVIRQVQTIAAAREAVAQGVDVIIAQGGEAGGHTGSVATMALVPQVVDLSRGIPVIAAGGIADGRGLVAALALGCEGINMGTRFMATKEAPIHQNVKEKIVSSDERATSLIFRTMRNTSRVYGNSIAKKAIEMEHEGKTIQEIGPIVSGAKGRVVYETGDLEHGVWSAGTCMGLISDIPSCKELVERIVREAEDMIRGRLSKSIAA